LSESREGVERVEEKAIAMTEVTCDTPGNWGCSAEEPTFEVTLLA
jgi:hypothetical protein